MGANSIAELISRDRSERKRQLFQGTLLDYLEIIKENPEIVCLAHERLYDLLIKPGVEVIKTEENPKLAADRDQNFERRLGQFLTLPDSPKVGFAPGFAFGIFKTAPSGNPAEPRRVKPLSLGVCNVE